MKKSVPVALRISAETEERLRLLEKSSGRSRSEVLRHLIDEEYRRSSASQIAGAEEAIALATQALQTAKAALERATAASEPSVSAEERRAS